MQIGLGWGAEKSGNLTGAAPARSWPYVMEKNLMLSAPTPENDDKRISSLRDMALLSTPREAELDRITRIASKLFGTEIALITLVDQERQWFKSRIGLDISETAREISFCGHTITSQETFMMRYRSKTSDERPSSRWTIAH